jgi:hypothetical protein
MEYILSRIEGNKYKYIMSFDPQSNGLNSLDSIIWSDGLVTNEELYLKMLQEERLREQEFKQFQEAELLRVKKESQIKSFKLKVFSWAGGIIVFAVVVGSFGTSASNKVSEAKAFAPVVSSQNELPSSSQSRVFSSSSVSSKATSSSTKSIATEVVKSQGVLTFEASSKPVKQTVTESVLPPAPVAPTPSAVLYFANCTQAHAAGYYRILQGQPGYRSKLDRDNDGIACE